MSDHDLGHRVRSSMLALQGRQAMLMLVNLGVGIILSRKLDPAVFGLFGIATFCLSLITSMMDFGLAGSLIQRKGEIKEHELSVAFTLQGIISVAAAILIWVTAPLSLFVYKQAAPELVWVIRALALPVLLSPIGTTARLQLEREIKFHKIATIDIAALVVSSLVQLAMVFTGFGVWSFVAGTIASALTSCAIAWTMIQFRPRFAIDWKLAREFFSFGIFFQIGHITNEAAGWIIPLIAGAGLGPAAVGLLTWSSSNGRRPLMIVDNVMRVAFPHFSRLQETPHELSHQVGLYFRRLLLVCYAWAFLGLTMGEIMTEIVYTEKWLPGVLALQLFALGLSLDVANWVGGMTLTAVGEVKETAKWTLVKSVIAIVGAIVGVKTIGMVGVPLASIAASLASGTGLLLRLRRKVPLDLSPLWKPAVPFLLATGCYAPFWTMGGNWKLAAGVALGALAIVWTSWKAYREFTEGRVSSPP